VSGYLDTFGLFRCFHPLIAARGVGDESIIFMTINLKPFSVQTPTERVSMSQHVLSIAPGVIIEHVGSDVVVMVPESTEVIKLSGDAAHIIRNIHAGDVHVLPSEAVSELVHRGIVVSQAGLSRRGLIKAGAIGASAGIAVMAMPGAAVAASTNGPSGPVPLVLDFQGIFGGNNDPTFYVDFGRPVDRFVPGGTVSVLSALLTNPPTDPVDTKDDWTEFGQLSTNVWDIRMVGAGRTLFSLANTSRIELTFVYDDITYLAVYVKP